MRTGLLKETVTQAVKQEFEQKNAAELEKIRAQNEAKVAALQSQLEALKAENQNKDAQIVGIGADSLVLQKLDEENQALKAELAALEAQDAAGLEQRIQSLETEKRDLAQQLAAAQSAPAPVLDESDLNALKSENDRLQRELVVAEGKVEIFDEMKAQVEALKAENAKLSRDYAE